MDFQPLAESFGVEVSDLNVGENITDDMVSRLSALLYDHAVVCIRDQRIDAQALATFGARLGMPTQHTEKTLHLDGLPTVMSLSNVDDRDERQLNGGAHWHTDLIHTDEPASFTLLHAVAVPPVGGGTLFANQRLAFDALPASLEQKIRDLIVVHCYEGRTDGSYPETHHPLVRAHPITGKKSLYGAADTGIGIVDMDQAEAMQLYLDIGEYATQDRFVYRHQYRLHDIVIWDNAQLLHSAEVLQRATSAEQHRIMYRVSVRGWPAV